MATGIIIAFVYSWEFSLFIIGLAPIFGIGGYLEMKVMAGLTGSEALEGAGQVSRLLLFMPSANVRSGRRHDVFGVFVHACTLSANFSGTDRDINRR